MHTLAATAERLRLVKTAEKRFLALWATECIFSQAGPLGAFATDVRTGSGARPAQTFGNDRNLFPPVDLDDVGEGA